DELIKNNPGIALLLSNRIDIFKQKNAMHLKVMEGRFNAIKEKYVEKDADGNYLTVEVGNVTQWKFLKSKVDLIRAATLTENDILEAYNEECENLFSQTVTIEM